MNSNTIAKFHLFGKVGKIVMTVLSVIAALLQQLSQRML